MAAALVGVGRVGEPVAEHPVAARERGSDHAVEMLAPRCEHEQRLAVVRHWLAQDQRPQRFAEGRPAGLARHDDHVPRSLEALGEPRHVRALAGTVDTLERDETAGACGHGESVDAARTENCQRPPFWNFATARL